MDYAAKDARPAAPQTFRVYACVLQRLPAHLQYEALLRIQELSLQGRNAEEGRIEPVYVINKGPKPARLVLRLEVREYLCDSPRAGARVTAITSDPGRWSGPTTVIELPGTREVPDWLVPFPALAACQLLAYHLGLARGLDVDSPRNLKKVTLTR